MSENPLDSLRQLAIELESKDNVPTLIDVYLDLFLEIASKINNEVYLKGNVLLNQIFPDTARGTKDLDMGVISKDVYDTVITPILESFGERLVSSNVAASYNVRPIQERMSGGIDVKDENNSTVYSVDVSLSDITPFGQQRYTFKGKNAYGSTIEKVIADKCLSTLSKKRFRRVKDFYDLYVISKSKIGYSAGTVLNLMVDAVGLEEVKRLYTLIPFSDEVLVQAGHAWEKLELFSPTYNKEITKPDFDEVIKRCYAFYRDIETYITY